MRRILIAFIPLVATAIAQTDLPSCTDAVKAYCASSDRQKPTDDPTACSEVVCDSSKVVASSATDPGFKQKAIDAHNKYRQTAFQGRSDSYGGDMTEVVWDDGLAAVALQYLQIYCQTSNGLDLGHDACRSTAKFAEVGQNLAYGGGGDWNKDAVDPDAQGIAGWYAEMHDTTSSDIDDFTSGSSSIAANKMIGHYTQLMWANSYTIGCAYIKRKASDEDLGNEGWVACNYAPEGNFIMEGSPNPVFTRTSKVGSNCKTGSKNTGVGGLCQVTDEATFRKNAYSTAP